MQRRATIACTAHFPRGTGLGNRLFYWARARVFCREHGLPMVAPRWWRPALGHLLRGTVSPERFAGQIALAGLFQAGPGDLPWHWRLGPQLAGRIIHEQDFEHGQDFMAAAGWADSWGAPQQDPGPVPDDDHRQGHGRALLLLDRPHYSFAGLNGHAPLLRQDLWAITRPRQLQRVRSVPLAPIGINIRCGRDFRPPPAAGAGAEWIGWLQQTPLAWFMETLQAVRDLAGEPVPALVVSDGSEQQLRPLLDLPAVRLVRPTTAIIDFGLVEFFGLGRFPGPTDGDHRSGAPLQPLGPGAPGRPNPGQLPTAPARSPGAQGHGGRPRAAGQRCFLIRAKPERLQSRAGRPQPWWRQNPIGWKPDWWETRLARNMTRD